MRRLSQSPTDGPGVAPAARARGTSCIRSLWTATRRGWQVTPRRSTLVLLGGDGDARFRDAAEWQTRIDEGDDWQCALVDVLGHSLIIVAPGSAMGVRLDGAPVAGGIACVGHGAWLRVGTGCAPRRWWLSREGPAACERAAAPGIDALTLEPFAVGEPIARCTCGETYRARTWEAQRRCVTCGHVEDGVYRDLPPRCGVGEGEA